jgi:Questin oxidase-like
MTNRQTFSPRRRFLREAATAAAALTLGPNLCCALPKAAPANSGGDAMDQALERMTGLALLSNHGPMAAEALVTMGRAEQVAAWVEAYKRRFTASYPTPHRAVTRANWRDALGDARREADWAEFFRRELKEAAWSRVVGQWAATLAPGLAAAAAHGLLRTAHAVRSLTVKETELRRRELADGLAYWAAHYQPLPDTLAKQSGKLKPGEALTQVPLLPEEKRRRGSIVTGLGSLDQLPEFARVADLIALPEKAAPFLSELTETFADVYVRQVQPRTAIALVHAVTGATALRSLLPHLSPSATRDAVRYAWQLGAAVYAVYGGNAPNPPLAVKEIKREELIDRAVDSGDEHAIKFTEACLREYALNPKQVYLQAARDAVGRF